MRSSFRERGLFETAVVFLLLFFAASPVRAARVEIVARSGGDRVSGASVCFSKASVAGTGGSFFSSPYLERMVSDAEVRCLPADQVLNLPVGTWHMTVETDREVSWHPFIFAIAGRGEENTSIKRLTCDLQPGATLETSIAYARLHPGQRIVIFAAPTRSSRSAIIPARQPEMIVPANVPITPMIFSENRIVAVGRSETLEAGGKAVASFPSASKERQTVVVPFVVRAEPGEPVEGKLQVLRSGSGALVKSFDLPEGGIDGLFIVPGVSPGTYRSTFVSEAWVADASEIEVAALDSAVHVARELTIKARPKLRVDWNIEPAFRVTKPRGPECGKSSVKNGAAAPAPRATITAWRCPAEVRALSPARTKACKSLLEAELSDEARGTVTWPSPGGSHLWLELRANGQSVFEQAAQGRDGSLNVSLSLDPPRITGRVTLGDNPAFAVVKCGSGSAATTDAATGQYECWYRGAARKLDFFGVSLCDGSEEYVHVVENPEFASVVDIAIPENRVAVRVLDGATGDGLEGAAVWLEPPKADTGLELLLRDLGRTPKDGRLATERVPLRDWSACAMKEGFEKRCKEVKLARNGETRVEITLHDATVIRGRIMTSRPIELGAVHVVDAAAHELEKALVSGDGTFSLRRAVMTSDARFILTSRSHPLLLLDVVRYEAPSLELRLPNHVERSFVVSSATQRGPVTVAIGDTIVPVNAFLRQQANHGQQYYLQPDAPINVAPIGASAEVAVILGVVPELIADPFGKPHLLALMPRQIVPAGVTRISF